jgi:hypothetical protein
LILNLAKKVVEEKKSKEEEKKKRQAPIKAIVNKPVTI